MLFAISGLLLIGYYDDPKDPVTSRDPNRA